MLPVLRQLRAVYCREGDTMTNNANVKHGHVATVSGCAYGGYCKRIVVTEKYIIKVLLSQS